MNRSTYTLTEPSPVRLAVSIEGERQAPAKLMGVGVVEIAVENPFSARGISSKDYPSLEYKPPEASARVTLKLTRREARRLFLYLVECGCMLPADDEPETTT